MRELRGHFCPTHTRFSDPVNGMLAYPYSACTYAPDNRVPISVQALLDFATAWPCLISVHPFFTEFRSVHPKFGSSFLRPMNARNAQKKRGRSADLSPPFDLPGPLGSKFAARRARRESAPAIAASNESPQPLRACLPPTQCRHNRGSQHPGRSSSSGSSPCEPPRPTR